VLLERSDGHEHRGRFDLGPGALAEPHVTTS
jgi:hypothetical protein